MRTEVGTLARRAAKVVALPAGVSGRRRPGDVVILLYHRVGDGRSEIELPVRELERHLAELVQRDTVLTLDETMWGDHEGGVVVTFDDGTPDFHAHVVPLLIRYGIPAVLYLATGLVEGEGMANGSAITWSQLEEAIQTGLVTVGSHTHDHADLSRSNEREVEEQMVRSKELIEDRLGMACRHFAYPWAVGSPVADGVARRLFDTAAWDAWRTNRRGEIDPHRLGRVPILRSDGQAFFRAKTKGMLDSEALLYRALRRGPWGRG